MLQSSAGGICCSLSCNIPEEDEVQMGLGGWSMIPGGSEEDGTETDFGAGCSFRDRTGGESFWAGDKVGGELSEADWEKIVVPGWAQGHLK